MIVTSSLIKELRARTSVGMTDCKKALEETNCNIEEAIDWLRKKGIAGSSKKAGRVASEGLIGLKTTDKLGVIAEVNSETDFVSRNNLFQEYVVQVLNTCSAKDLSMEQLKKEPYDDSTDFENKLKALVGVIGENLQIRRLEVLKAPNNGVVVGYIHNKITSVLGKLGVLVSLEVTKITEEFNKLAMSIAMHIAASNPVPLAVNREDLSPELVEKEKKIISEQIAGVGKSADIMNKMIEGKLKKYYTDVVLLEQIYMLDTSKTVGKLIKEFCDQHNTNVKITRFVRYALGEGIEKTGMSC